MKIVASTGHDKFLVEMTHREIATLSGVPYREERERIVIGATLAAGENADKIEAITERHYELKQSAANLRRLADMLDAGLNGILPPEKEEGTDVATN